MPQALRKGPDGTFGGTSGNRRLVYYHESPWKRWLRSSGYGETVKTPLFMRAKKLADLLRAAGVDELASDALSIKCWDKSPVTWKCGCTCMAAGTLNARDARRVEKRSPAIRTRPAICRDPGGITPRHRAERKALGAPSARAMQKLFAAIDAEPPRKPGRPSKSPRGLPTSSPACPRARWPGRRARARWRSCCKPA